MDSRPTRLERTNLAVADLLELGQERYGAREATVWAIGCLIALIADDEHLVVAVEEYVDRSLKAAEIRAQARVERLAVPG